MEKRFDEIKIGEKFIAHQMVYIKKNERMKTPNSLRIHDEGADMNWKGVRFAAAYKVVTME